ncbi:MAG TPA: hypothetical protein VHR86_00505, partial [Armatimonadota bacterium]|nr:hypothetical protein [Armatimonadota bacterium]
MSGDQSAETDLKLAANYSPEDWRSQMLYGESLALSNQPVLAKGQLRRAAMLAPWRPEPWLALTNFARQANDANLEYAGLAGLMRVFPEDPGIKMRMAALYQTLGQPDAAQRLQASVEAILPPVTLSAVFMHNGRAATLQELRDFAQSEPDNPDVFAALATEEWRAGNGEGVYQALLKKHQLTPNDQYTTLTLSRICFLSARADEGVELLKTISEGNDIAQRNIVLWDASRGRYADALPALRMLLQKTPDDPILNRQFGVLCLLCGDTSSAISALQTSWDKAPSDITAQSYIIALLQAGKTQDAEDIAKRAIQLFPNEYMLQVILAHVYKETDRLVQAADLTALAAGYRPETVELSILAAERYIASGKFNRAVPIAQHLRDAFPNDLVAMHGAVQLFRTLCMTPDAVLTLTRYLGPNITSPLPRTALLMEVAQYATDENRLFEASSALTELIRTDPRYRPAYDLLAQVYMQQRRWTDIMALDQSA